MGQSIGLLRMILDFGIKHVQVGVTMNFTMHIRSNETYYSKNNNQYLHKIVSVEFCSVYLFVLIVFNFFMHIV